MAALPPDTRKLARDERQEMLDTPPHYAGLQRGDVVDRWTGRQAPVDLFLFRLIVVVTLGGLLWAASLLLYVSWRL